MVTANPAQQTILPRAAWLILSRPVLFSAAVPNKIDQPGYILSQTESPVFSGGCTTCAFQLSGMNAYTQPWVSCFQYIEMHTKEGGEEEVKEVKITISEPFGAGYMDKNILLVTPAKWESAVREFTTIYLVCALEDFRRLTLGERSWKKIDHWPKLKKAHFLAMERILVFSQRKFYRNKKHILKAKLPLMWILHKAQKI